MSPVGNLLSPLGNLKKIITLEYQKVRVLAAVPKTNVCLSLSKVKMRAACPFTALLSDSTVHGET